MLMCVVVIILQKYGEAISRNSLFPSFSCNLFINMHILISAMHNEWVAIVQRSLQNIAHELQNKAQEGEHDATPC